MKVFKISKRIHAEYEKNLWSEDFKKKKSRKNTARPTKLFY